MKKYEAKVGDLITPNRDCDDFVKGKPYRVQALDSDGDVGVVDETGNYVYRYAEYFDFYTPHTVYYKGKAYKIDSRMTIESDIVAQKINTLWYIIPFYESGHREFYILKHSNAYSMVPIKLCSETPPSKTIKLTNDYDAEIGKDFVKVGCQTIPIAKVKEILEEHAKLTQ